MFIIIILKSFNFKLLQTRQTRHSVSKTSRAGIKQKVADYIKLEWNRSCYSEVRDSEKKNQISGCHLGERLQ